jgi:hypothetical protein
MTKKELFLVWLPCATIIGFALGYLYSAKFCRISIVDRVANTQNINQQIHLEWASQAYFARQAIIALTNKTADADTLSALWITQHATVFNSLKAFMSPHAVGSLQQIVIKNSKQIIDTIAAKDTSVPLAKDAFKALSDALATQFARLNPIWANNFTAFEASIEKQYELIVEQVNARDAKNWHADANASVEFFTNAQEIASEIDTGITKQFQSRL